MTNTYSLNLNKTLVFSAILHASVFAAAVLFSMKTIKPLPIGVEISYDEVPSMKAPTAPATAPAPVKRATVQEVVNKEDITKKSKIPTMAESNPATTATSSGATTGTVATREGVADGVEVSSEQRYLYELKKLLERRKSYPMMAKKMGHAGTVTMRFTLKADGSIAESEVVEKAPYETLNQAALTLVRGINGMKPFPTEIHRDTWSITVPIEYKLN